MVKGKKAGERELRFNKPITEVGRFATSRERFRSTVVDRNLQSDKHLERGLRKRTVINDCKGCKTYTKNSRI